MAYRRTPLALHEWYHCYSRGVDKRITFKKEDDYQRFEQLLYLANDTQSIDRNLFPHTTHERIFERARKKPIVRIAAYCLMPNHFHLLLQEIRAHGISSFMQKLGTGYAMYFNNKNDRIGNLFVKPFRSKHISKDRYLKHVVQYIHLNPAELFESNWKRGEVQNMRELERHLCTYPHSSLIDYINQQRSLSAIIDKKAFELFADLPPLKNVLAEAAAYYRELGGVAS